MDDEESSKTFGVILVDDIRNRIEESVRWHRSRGSSADDRRLIDIGAKHEAERLEQLAEKAEKEGQDGLVDFWHSLKEDVLPQIAHELKAAR